MSSSGVVVPAPDSSPRDFQATSNVALPDVSRVVVPLPVNRSPFHWVLALLTTGLGMISPSVLGPEGRGTQRRAAPLITPQPRAGHTGGESGKNGIERSRT